jgi:hypothetical protein
VAIHGLAGARVGWQPVRSLDWRHTGEAVNLSDFLAALPGWMGRGNMRPAVRRSCPRALLLRQPMAGETKTKRIDCSSLAVAEREAAALKAAYGIEARIEVGPSGYVVLADLPIKTKKSPPPVHVEQHVDRNSPWSVAVPADTPPGKHPACRRCWFSTTKPEGESSVWVCQRLDVGSVNWTRGCLHYRTTP